jgi:hypothetical protein
MTTHDFAEISMETNAEAVKIYENAELTHELIISEMKREEKFAKKMENNSDVIFIDSDDDGVSKPVHEKTLEEPDRKEVANECPVVEAMRESKSEAASNKVVKRRDCINTECPRTASDYIECPRLTLNFYFATIKVKKVQYVCSVCHKKALETYEVSLQNLFFFIYKCMIFKYTHNL